jgi:hypothetical protein
MGESVAIAEPPHIAISTPIKVFSLYGIPSILHTVNAVINDAARVNSVTEKVFNPVFNTCVRLNHEPDTRPGKYIFDVLRHLKLVHL